MLRVINISKRSLVISGIRIMPEGHYDFDEKTMSTVTRNRINSLARIGLVKLVSIIPDPQPQPVYTESVVENNIENTGTENNEELDNIASLNIRKSSRKSTTK